VPRSTQSFTAYFHVRLHQANHPVAPQDHDWIARSYVDFPGCNLHVLSDIPPPDLEPFPSRLGPRLGITRDDAQPSPNAWVFTVVPEASTNHAGKLLALKVETQGQGAHAWTDVSSILGTLYSTSSGPIAAARSNAFGGEPLVVVQKDGQHIAAIVRNNAGGWSEAVSGPLDWLGNSIAIAETPEVDLVGSRQLEFIFAVGGDGRVYETRLVQCTWPVCIPATFVLAPWTVVGQPDPNNPIDIVSDSLAAATWIDMNGDEFASIYARGVSVLDGSDSAWTRDVEAFGGSATSAWANMTVPGVANWPTLGGVFFGGTSVIRVSGLIPPNHEAYGICQVPGSDNLICEARRTSGMTNFTWRFLTS
jgi:hypothetical protein